jgi:neprilysin
VFDNILRWGLKATNEQVYVIKFYFSFTQMTRYKQQQTDFADEDASSIGSIHLNEVRTSPNMHIRFANRVSFEREIFGKCFKFNNNHWQSSFSSLWQHRNKLERILLTMVLTLFITCAIFIVILLTDSERETRILHVKQHPSIRE